MGQEFLRLASFLPKQLTHTANIEYDTRLFPENTGKDPSLLFRQTGIIFRFAFSCEHGLVVSPALNVRIDERD
jgi:hypothetical protein